MGGFFLILILCFIIVPITVILAIIGAISKKVVYGKAIGLVWLSIPLLVLLYVVASIFTQQKKIKQNDIYGEYVVDRTKFAGKQADWQYNHFRFEITKDDKLLFYVTDREKIIKTYKEEVRFKSDYSSPHILLKSDSSLHHIIEEPPTLYRHVWSFYYVFKSPKFGNVFFKKGHWKPI